jgi:transposase InsO family protein
MCVARLVVTAVKIERRTKASVARDYGIARSRVHELIRRYECEGGAGLEPRSRRPHRSPRQVDRQLEDQFVALRKQLTDQGLDAGAATIAALLERDHCSARRSPPSGGSWSRRGVVTPQPQKRPKSSYVRFEAAQPHQRWQADTTHWPLADGTKIEILNILDDHSRLAIASVARATFKAADVVPVFLPTIRPLPASR